MTCCDLCAEYGCGMGHICDKCYEEAIKTKKENTVMGLELMSCPFCGHVTHVVIEGTCKDVNKKYKENRYRRDGER